MTEDNEHFKSVDGVLFTKDGSELLFYPPLRKGKSYIVPESVNVFALAATEYLADIYLPYEKVVEFKVSTYRTGDLTIESIYVPASMLDDYIAVGKLQSLFKPLPEDWLNS